VTALEKENVQLKAALEVIATAKPLWSDNVGCYAGGETYAGFAERLRQVARVALTRPELGKVKELTALLREAELALEPFANIAQDIAPRYTERARWPFQLPTVGEYRRSQAALEKIRAALPEVPNVG